MGEVGDFSLHPTHYSELRQIENNQEVPEFAQIPLPFDLLALNVSENHPSYQCYG
jgi:hypothetical protein